MKVFMRMLAWRMSSAICCWMTADRSSCALMSGIGWDVVCGGCSVAFLVAPNHLRNDIEKEIFTFYNGIVLG